MKKRETKDIQFIKQPHYPGGQKALSAFVTSNLKYPKDAIENKIEGTVVLRYGINGQGKVIEVKVLGSLGHGCDEEAVRLVKKLQFEVPKNRKKKIIFHKNIQIHFRLPKQEEKVITPSPATSFQVSYTVTQGKQPDNQSSPNEQKPGGYSYTIQY